MILQNKNYANWEGLIVIIMQYEQFGLYDEFHELMVLYTTQIFATSLQFLKDIICVFAIGLVQNSDPAPLNEALWGEYQKLRKVLHCNQTYFLHRLMQKWLLCDIPIKTYEMLDITMYDVIQNNFTEIWAVKDSNLCVLLYMGQSRRKMFHNTSYLPHFH